MTEESPDALARPVSPHKDTVGLVLPCDIDHFGEFVSSLLGKTQAIEGAERGTFDITTQDILNAIHLVTQRVNAQNEASLAAFEITVIYSNGNKVSHNTIDSFNTYHPVEDCFPLEVVASMVFLVHFVGRTIPEKQSVEIAFVAKDHDWREDRRRYRPSGTVEFRVEYTERTWGSDISNILKNHAKSVVDKKGRLWRRLSDWFEEVTLAVVLASFALAVGIWAWYTASRSSEIVSGAGQMMYFSWSFFVFVCLGALLVFMRELFQFHLSLYRASSIVLVERDYEHRRKIHKKHLRAILLAVGGWLMSVLAGVISAYAHTYLI